MSNPTEPTYYASPESTNQYGGPVPPMPTKAPKKPKQWLVPVLIAVALVFGAGMGNASAAVKPAEIQIQEKEVEKIVEKKVPVPTTPASCIDAITYAEQVMESSSRAFGVMGEMFKAAAKLDAATMTALSPKIDDETDTLNRIRPKYQSARDSCKASR